MGDSLLKFFACVCSILDYGSEVFGFEGHDSALQIHLRAARSFLGVPKNSPIPGILSEFNQLLPKYRGHIRMIRQYHRLLKSSVQNVSRKVFDWDKNLNEQNVINSWYNDVRNIFYSCNLGQTFENGTLFDLKSTVEHVKNQLIENQQNILQMECTQKPKLRTFVKFKDFYSTPSYLTKPLSFIQRKFVAKIRLGCLEIRLETGRWARPRLVEESRICQVCENLDQDIEDEFHFTFECLKYQPERQKWFEKLVIPDNFQTLTKTEKLGIVLNHPCNVKLTSQYLINIFDIRSKIIKDVQGALKTFHLYPLDICPACNPIMQ